MKFCKLYHFGDAFGPLFTSRLRSQTTDGNPSSFISHHECLRVNLVDQLSTRRFLHNRYRFLSVCFAVLQHVIFSDESLSALITSIRLGSTVKTHVPSEICLVVELLGTQLTLEWLFPAMLRQMFLVRLIAGESFPAPVTLERLITRMECFVVLRQIARLVEYFVALLASENFSETSFRRQSGSRRSDSWRAGPR